MGGYTGERRILVVEDDEDLREEIAYAVAYGGYQVETATDGANALQLLQKTFYDAVITDVFMPVMDGLELSEHINLNYPGTKIILISGGSRTTLNDYSYLRAGEMLTNIDDTLEKPFKNEELLGMLEKIINDN